MQAVLLAEVLSCQNFLQIVGGKALKSLMAISSQLRKAVQSLVKSVRLKANLDVLVKNYPFLERLQFRHPIVFSMSVMAKGLWPHLKKLILQGQESQPRMVELKTIVWLTEGDWPTLEFLDLSFNSLPAEAMNQLARGKWPELKQISIAGANFTKSCAQNFQLGDWTQLGCLQLRNCNVSAEGMAYLVQGQWPHLTHLDLHGNGLGSYACDFLSQAHWPALKVLILSNTLSNLIECQYKPGNVVAADWVQKLSKTQWSSLMTLGLSNNALSFSHEAMGHFVASPAIWQVLQRLDLSSNKFCAPMMHSLASAEFPCLRGLNLANCALDSIDLKVLGTSQWQMLECLIVGPKEYDAACIKALQGSSVKQLKKGSNNVTGWLGLASGHWPLTKLLVIADKSEWFSRWQ